MKLKTDKLTYISNKRRLISDITLEFSPGFIYGVLGPNGSGKTTLLKNISGILTPTSGKVLWNGEDLLKLPRKEVSTLLTFVPQAVPIPFDFTIEEIVLMGRYPHRDKNEELVRKAMEETGVWELRKQPISQVSGGERQRAYCARALATGAPILLLDEPTAHLDLRYQLEIWKLLRSLSKEKIIIISVHDLHAAERFCDQVIVLDRGQCTDSGQFSDVVTTELLKTVFGVHV